MTTSEYVKVDEIVYTSNDNIAIYGTATQSSTEDFGYASRAIDQNTSGVWADSSVTQTEAEDSAWWEVDLGETYNIGEIIIYNRTDTAYMDRLSNFTIYVIDSSSNISYSQSFTSYPDPSITIDVGGVYGEVVRVQLDDANTPLSLAEVEVFQYQYPVSFLLKNSINSESLEGVSVTVNGDNYITDSNGEATAFLNGDSHIVTFTKLGYTSKTMSINVSSDTLISVELEQNSFSFTFNVTEVSHFSMFDII
jgi:hypothetical protein